MGSFEEASIAHVIEKGEQAIKETLDIEKAYGFSMEAELEPGECLKKFVQRAKAAWECDEAITEIHHPLFALMHGADDVELGESGVAQLLFHECVGDDADDFAASRECGIGDGAHEAHSATPIDEADVLAGERGGHVSGGLFEDWVEAAVGAAVDGDAHVGFGVWVGESGGMGAALSPSSSWKSGIQAHRAEI